MPHKDLDDHAHDSDFTVPSDPSPSGSVRFRRVLGLISWCFYDWANSPFSTLIVTFVFSVYFRNAVAASPEQGERLWGYMISLTGLIIAFLAPVLGIIADQRPQRKPLLALMTAITVLASGSLWFIAPDPDWTLPALLLVGVGILSFEFGIIFNNAMLKDIAQPDYIGRLSGWGWGVGYFGAIVCLILVLFVFVLPKTPPFGLDNTSQEQIRILGPIVGLWLLIFSLPLFLFTPDRPILSTKKIRAIQALKQSWHHFRGLLKQLRHHPNLLRFLLASMLYRDGMVALFSFGGLFAAARFGMEQQEVIRFAILLNISAGFGALLFAYVDDAFGSWTTILFSLGGLILFSALALGVQDKFLFYGAGAGIGLFVGPTQAASRTYLARLASQEDTAAFFGLYAMAGKATVFIAPATIAWLTLYYDLATAMWSIIGFLSFGWILLLTLKK